MRTHRRQRNWPHTTVRPMSAAVSQAKLATQPRTGVTSTAKQSTPTTVRSALTVTGSSAALGTGAVGLPIPGGAGVSGIGDFLLGLRSRGGRGGSASVLRCGGGVGLFQPAAELLDARTAVRRHEVPGVFGVQCQHEVLDLGGREGETPGPAEREDPGSHAVALR